MVNVPPETVDSDLTLETLTLETETTLPEEAAKVVILEERSIFPGFVDEKTNINKYLAYTNTNTKTKHFTDLDKFNLDWFLADQFLRMTHSFKNISIALKFVKCYPERINGFLPKLS